jgi:hypothetical protein
MARDPCIAPCYQFREPLLKDSPTNDQHDLLFYGQEKAKRLLVGSRDLQMEGITEKRHQCIGGLTSMKIDGSDLYIFSRDLCR